MKQVVQVVEICFDLVLLQVIIYIRDRFGFVFFINFGEGQEEKEYLCSSERFQLFFIKRMWIDKVVDYKESYWEEIYYVLFNILFKNKLRFWFKSDLKNINFREVIFLDFVRYLRFF